MKAFRPTSISDLIAGDRIFINAKHPHGPTKAQVLRIEKTMFGAAPVCCALDKRGEFDQSDTTTFFVMNLSDLDARKKVERP